MERETSPKKRKLSHRKWVAKQAMSNFAKVVEFNRGFGTIPDGPPTGPKISVLGDKKEIDSCLALIREEVNELEEAVRDSDFVEMVDALTDILYVAYGMGARIGVDMDAAFSLVHANNMSKMCQSEVEAKESVTHHREMRTCANPSYRQAGDGKWVVFNADTKKILKPKAWHDVDLRGVCGLSPVSCD